MANQYDTNLKLQAIADAIGDSSSSGLISALEDIADAVAGGGGGGSSTAGLVSDNFSETDTYDLGDYCIHNNTMYVCINAITTPGPWDLSDWQATNAGLQLSSLNSAIAEQGNYLSIIKTQIEGTHTSLPNLSQYKYIMVAIRDGDILINPAILPYKMFKAGISAQSYIYSTTTGSRRYVRATYDSDTSITLKMEDINGDGYAAVILLN